MLVREKYFICKHCENLVELIDDNHVDLVCCNTKMTELTHHTDDAGYEKHLPHGRIDGDKVFVTIGNGEHPMTAEHSIQWIALETTTGMQRKYIHQEYVSTSDSPKATFALCDDKPVGVYAYCNLHGLWVGKLET